MVNSKRLLSGQTGFRFDLVSEISRRLGYKAIPEWMDKDIRNEFADHDGILTNDQILYNAADTIRLKPLLAEQLRQAAAQNQLFLLSTINSRLIIPIAEAEMFGIRHNAEKWNNVARERKQRADEICKELDRLVVEQYQLNPEEINPALKDEREKRERRVEKLELRKVKLSQQLKQLEEKGKTHLKSYQTQKEQLEKLLTTPQESVQEDIGIINWGSQPQVLRFFKKVGVTPPTAKDKNTKELKAGVGKEARANWFVNNPDSPFTETMTHFDKYKKLIHNVKSFGEKWVQNYTNPITGRVHTKLDQAGADTGRFTSGSKGKKKKYPNMQQIPSLPEYRECFEADEGRTLITLDYSNCEGVVMTSLSGDMNMKEIIQMRDSHSYLGTKCWRSIYHYRYSKTGDPKWLELSQSYEMNKSTPEKEKERHVFKNSGGLFPVAYGVAAAKVAATSKITNTEGQVMIDTIKAEIPDVIEFLDGKSREAVKNGYVVHNTRTGSRRWFSSILDHLHYGWPLSKSEIAEVEFAARNSPIQGTNSDLMKEAIIMIDLWRRLFKQDIQFLLTVHDEYVCSVPTEQAEFLGGKIKELMKRAAKNYLIKEIEMDVDMRIAQHWKK